MQNMRAQLVGPAAYPRFTPPQKCILSGGKKERTAVPFSLRLSKLSSTHMVCCYGPLLDEKSIVGGPKDKSSGPFWSSVAKKPYWAPLFRMFFAFSISSVEDCTAAVCCSISISVGVSAISMLTSLASSLFTLIVS